jgi:20S proteasome alpha/beta subunit
VLASDSQGTLGAGAPALAIKGATLQKVVKVSDAVLMGGSGSSGLMQRLEHNLKPHEGLLQAGQPRNGLKRILFGHANALQQQARAEWTGFPKTQQQAWGGLFVGWSADGPFILHVSVDGAVEFCDSHAAEGSGTFYALLAIATVRHHDFNAIRLPHAQTIAYRAIEVVCQASAFGVSVPVQMGVVTEDEGARMLSDDELKLVADSVNIWKALDKEGLTKALVASGHDIPPLPEPAAEDGEGLDPPEDPPPEDAPAPS